MMKQETHGKQLLVLMVRFLWLVLLFNAEMVEMSTVETLP
jgi:hypothetical protein